LTHCASGEFLPWFGPFYTPSPALKVARAQLSRLKFQVKEGELFAGGWPRRAIVFLSESILFFFTEKFFALLSELTVVKISISLFYSCSFLRFELLWFQPPLMPTYFSC